MWHWVVWWILSDISEEHTTSVVRVINKLRAVDTEVGWTRQGLGQTDMRGEKGGSQQDHIEERIREINRKAVSMHSHQKSYV
jgi:hypothetical protein